MATMTTTRSSPWGPSSRPSGWVSTSRSKRSTAWDPIKVRAASRHPVSLSANQGPKTSRYSAMSSTTSVGVVRGTVWGAGSGVRRRPALRLVAGDEFEEPGLGDAVLGGDLGNGSVLDHHGGDQQTL